MSQRKSSTSTSVCGVQSYHHLLLLSLFYSFFLKSGYALSNSTGPVCRVTSGKDRCQTFVVFRANAPNYLDLASIGDLFDVSRLRISRANNLSSTTSPLVEGQYVLVPITCSCKLNISFAGIPFTFKKDDTYYIVSTTHFQNLTTYQSVMKINPTLKPENISIGAEVVFPIFCKCPNQTQNYTQLITYVFQNTDNLSSIAKDFGSDVRSILDANDNQNPESESTIFIPVFKLPVFKLSSSSSPSPSPGISPTLSTCSNKKWVVAGLAVSLGFLGVLLITILVSFCVLFSRISKSKNKKEISSFGEEEKNKIADGVSSKEQNILADVSDYLDKYKLYGIHELKEATSDFNPSFIIQGSVYKGCIGNQFFAIKKMKWDAYEELKILQKVNHGNLVKLEGFCVDPEGGNCFLVYEYAENGSLQSWLHGSPSHGRLNWKSRLTVAIDVANGLQYIHEHTRPTVVHKDIKTSNILLDKQMRAKIANFGLARSGFNAITTHVVGTKGYIAPEYLLDGVVTTKMDIFAFGVVLLELISGREAISEDGKVLWMEVGRLHQGESDDKEVVKFLMDPDLLEEKSIMESVMNVVTVARACIDRNPSKRPTMTEISYMLSKAEALLGDLTEKTIIIGDETIGR